MEIEAPKQWIILRKDLKMRKGKMIAQGAHASMSVLLQLMDTTEVDGKANRSFQLPIDSAMNEWIAGAFTKIALSVDSEEELVKLYESAKFIGLPCSLIEDNGLTEFNGVKTKTAVAIGPAYPSQVAKLTGHLNML